MTFTGKPFYMIAIFVFVSKTAEKSLNPFAAAKKMFEFFREILYSGSYKQKNESY